SWCRCRTRSTRTSSPMRGCSNRPAARSASRKTPSHHDGSRTKLPRLPLRRHACKPWPQPLAQSAGSMPRTASPIWCSRWRPGAQFSRYFRCRLFAGDGQERVPGAPMRLPRDIGPVHFVGIGGIGMSGIAEVLVNLGYTVQGSDVADSANVKRLRDKGVTVAIGHAAENLTGARVVVVSSAIRRDNPELAAARAERLPVVRRAEMLAELMRLKSCVAIAGTHGKTTTTSMVAALLDAAGFDPTVINGGIINAYGTNARLGAGEWMVVEADESDGTFLKLPADVAIVTNVDPEHLDHFKTFDAVQDAFRAFVENVPFYGFSVMCTDHPVVQNLVGRIE